MLKRHAIQVLRHAGHTLHEIVALVAVGKRTVQRVVDEPMITDLIPRCSPTEWSHWSERSERVGLSAARLSRSVPRADRGVAHRRAGVAERGAPAPRETRRLRRGEVRTV